MICHSTNAKEESKAKRPVSIKTNNFHGLGIDRVWDHSTIRFIMRNNVEEEMSRYVRIT